MKSLRGFLRRATPPIAGLLVVAGLVLAACAPAAPPTPTPAPAKPAAPAPAAQPTTAPKPAAPAPTAASAKPAAPAPTAAPAAKPPAQLEKITFTLSWLPNGRYGFYYVAQDKGWYREQGLDVSVIRGAGGNDALTKIAQGNAQMGEADLGPLVQARANAGLKIKTVATVYSNPPNVVLFYADTGIKTPKDLEGKKFATSPGDSFRQILPAFAKVNGVDIDKFQWVTMEPAAKVPAFLERRVDVSPTYIFDKIILDPIAKQRNLPEIKHFLFSDYRMTFYGNSIVAPESLMREKPQVVRGFVQASLRALEWTLDNPKEMAAILKKYNAEINEDVAAAEMPILKQLVWSDEAKKNGIGFLDPAKVKSTRDLIRDTFELKSDVAVEDLYTNEFLPRKP